MNLFFLIVLYLITYVLNLHVIYQATPVSVAIIFINLFLYVLRANISWYFPGFVSCFIAT